MTRGELSALWEGGDLIGAGMQADTLRSVHHPYGIVSYFAPSDGHAEDSCVTLTVPPSESVDGLIESLEQVRQKAPLAVQPLTSGNATGSEYLKLLAICRLYLPDVHSIQAAPHVVGLKVAQLALRFGADDMGEAEGEGTEEGFRRVIRDAGFTPKQRDGQRRLYFLL